MADKLHSATIIVAVIVIQDDKLLMMQEAKPECRGKWYIPGASRVLLALNSAANHSDFYEQTQLAGRCEVGEDIITAAQRETFEETGLELEVDGVFSLRHMVHGNKDWIRYGISGRIVGGSLKKKADAESLQGEWVPLSDIQSLQLRARDFLDLVKQRQECTQLIKLT